MKGPASTVQPVLGIGYGVVDKLFQEVSRDDLRTILEDLESEGFRHVSQQLQHRLRVLYLGISAMEGMSEEALMFLRTQVFSINSVFDSLDKHVQMAAAGEHPLLQPLATDTFESEV